MIVVVQRNDNSKESTDFGHTTTTTLFVDAVGEAVNVFDGQRWSARASWKHWNATIESNISVRDPRDDDRGRELSRGNRGTLSNPRELLALDARDVFTRDLELPRGRDRERVWRAHRSPCGAA